jgi:hypothetical protein
MKRSMRILAGVALLLCIRAAVQEARGQITVAVTGYSSSTGATVVATSSFGGFVQLQSASSLVGPWLTLTSHDFGTNTIWQYQDAGAIGPIERYYRAVLALWAGGGGGVYSVNVAGLMKLSTASGLILTANPLNAIDNTVAGAFRTPVNGMTLFRLTASGFEANNYLFGWLIPSMPFTPGEGFFLRDQSSITIPTVFFGEVPVDYLKP